MDRKNNNMLTDISAELENEFGHQGTPERESAIAQAWEEYNAQVLLDARKNANRIISDSLIRAEKME